MCHSHTPSRYPVIPLLPNAAFGPAGLPPSSVFFAFLDPIMFNEGCFPARGWGDIYLSKDNSSVGLPLFQQPLTTHSSPGGNGA